MVADEATKVAKTAVKSARDNLKGDHADTLLHRLKQTVLNLRQRTDYNQSVGIISKLIRRYAQAYSRVAEATLQTASQDIDTNPALDKAIRNFWDLLSSFGDRQQWEQLEQDFKKVMEHAQSDPQFEEFMNQIGHTVQTMLTDPEGLQFS